jgi:Domain of unknown function (DUF6265)
VSRLLVLILVAACSLVAPARAQAPERRATIDDAAWLAGHWVGEGLGGLVEENWSPPRGGQMVGHFALVKEGKPVFYEIMLLDEHDGGLRMRVKHFGPDFIGWEEKGGWHSFEPRAVGPKSLAFQGLTLRLDDGELVATITMRDRQTGTVRDEVLRHRRAPL